MDNKIPTGIRNHIELTVTANHSAREFGSGMIDVFATPAMIALMEKTAMESVHAHIPPGKTTVGTEINIKHLKATPIGKVVRAESYLKKTVGRKLLFELHAWDHKGMIGIGTHTRVVVEEKEFLKNIS